MDIKEIFLVNQESDFEESLTYWKKRAEKPNLIEKGEFFFFKYIVSFFVKKNVIFIFGSRMEKIVVENSNDYNVVSLGRGNLKKRDILKNHIIIFPVKCWYWKLIRLIETDEKKADKYLNQTGELMKRMNAKALVLVDMFSATQRGLSFAAHTVGIPVAFYEHGSILNAKTSEKAYLYNKTFVPKFADFFWFWSKKNMLDSIEMGIAKEENSFIIGYPYEYKKRVDETTRKNTVLLVGNVHLNIYPNSNIFYMIVKELYYFCKENEIEFTYRKHPKEKNKYIEELEEIGIQFSKNPLGQDLENNFIVIGANTSVVLEAGLYNDFVIQIVWDRKIVGPFLFDNAYQTENNIAEIKELILDAIKGRMQPKEIEKDNLMYGELQQRTRIAVDEMNNCINNIYK